MADIVDSLKFWTTIRQIYRGDQNRLMLGLDMRRFAQAGALACEMTSWEDNRHCNIPEMLAFHQQWLEETVTEFMGSDSHEQLVASGCQIGTKMDITQRLYHLLLVPDTRNFYCLHCRNNVTITEDLLCPECGGWYLLEMCSTSSNLPRNPTKWNDIGRQLNPFPSHQEPPLSGAALMDVEVTADISCSICRDNFENGDTGTQATCGHLYHRECIEPWLQGKRAKQRQCPLCRQLLRTSDALFNIHLRVQALNEGIHFPV